MKTFKFVLAALLIGGGAGFIPMYLKLQDAQQQAAAEEGRLTTELDASRQELTLSRIHSRMGVLITQVRARNFEAARRTSTQLYDEIGSAIESIGNPDDERRLRTVADTRDQVTAALALNDPAIETTLWRLFELLSASLP